MTWLTGNLYQFFSPPWAATFLGAAAIICGAIVGAERERKEKSAGLRTMILVCLGAAVFTMVSLAVAGPADDRGRIAAQVVTGIGFLGAGAILRGTTGVHGMTTAASIWATAAIGMVVGTGYAGAGLILSVTVFLLLVLLATVEHRYLGPCRLVRSTLAFGPAGGKTAVKIQDILDQYHVPQESRSLEKTSEGLMRLSFTYCRAHRHHKNFLTQIAAIPDVKEIIHD
ncbi:MAG: MgtC/SapB family protein [Acidobacteriota bacterium]